LVSGTKGRAFESRIAHAHQIRPFAVFLKSRFKVFMVGGCSRGASGCGLLVQFIHLIFLLAGNPIRINVKGELWRMVPQLLAHI
jgi:hypothetical protein